MTKMTSEELFSLLKERFIELLRENGLENESVTITCRALSPEEALGETKRKDFPILTGKDIMIQAECRGCRGQAFTDAPAAFSGTLADVLALDLNADPHARGLFVAVLNAVLGSLGKCSCTVHCRKSGPENCAKDARAYLKANYPQVKRVTLVGYQPALLEMLATSGYDLRVLDLNPDNIGQTRYGVTVEHGVSDMADAVASAELILCTGSTLCNGTMVDYLDLDKEVLFFGITAAGAGAILGLKRLCFADDYPA